VSDPKDLGDNNPRLLHERHINLFAATLIAESFGLRSPKEFPLESVTFTIRIKNGRKVRITLRDETLQEEGATPTGDLTKVLLGGLRYCFWHPEVIASYDVRTKLGPWAYACIKCFPLVAAQQELGTGWGQMIEYAPGTEGLADETDISTDVMLKVALKEGVSIEGLPDLVLRQIARHATYQIARWREQEQQ
jgi:hypothetical protein